MDCLHRHTVFLSPFLNFSCSEIPAFGSGIEIPVSGLFPFKTFTREHLLQDLISPSNEAPFFLFSETFFLNCDQDSHGDSVDQQELVTSKSEKRLKLSARACDTLSVHLN